MSLSQRKRTRRIKKAWGNQYGPRYELAEGPRHVIFVGTRGAHDATVHSRMMDGEHVWTGSGFGYDRAFRTAVDAAAVSLSCLRARQTPAALHDRIRALESQVADLQGWVSSIRARMPGAP